MFTFWKGKLEADRLPDRFMSKSEHPMFKFRHLIFRAIHRHRQTPVALA